MRVVYERGIALLIILTVLLAGINLATPYFSQGSGTIFVSATHGNNWNQGYSPDSALRTIQAAADLVRPGDTILVGPGIYPESVHLRRGGAESRPVVLKAEIPGTVTITQAAPGNALEQLSWRDEGGGVWSSRPPWSIHALRADGLATYHLRWGGLDELRDLGQRSGKWPMSVHDESTGLLYLFLPGQKSPADVKLITHRAIPPAREWYQFKAANLWLEADFIEVEGIVFDLGVGAGIRLWDTASVVIRNCMFQGAMAGVDGRPHSMAAEMLSLENNLYHNYPQYHWLADGLLWRDLYRHYSTYSLISNAPSGSVIRNNLVAHFADGVGVMTGADPTAAPIEISGNLLFYGTDDVFEIEGEARNVRIENNLVFEAHESLGLSPVLGGPVIIRNNLFLHLPTGINGAQIKLLAPEREGQKVPTIRNIHIDNNGFVGNWLSWWRETPFENVVISNNYFQVMHAKTPVFPPGVEAINNEIIRQSVDSGRVPGSVLARRWPELWQKVVSIQEADLPPGIGPEWLDLSEFPFVGELSKEINTWTSSP